MKFTPSTVSKHATKAAQAYGWQGGAFLSLPGKMPGFTWSIPAGKTCPASKISLREHGDSSTCAGCYAKTGNYLFPGVKQAHKARLSFLLASLRDDGGTSWVNAMVAAIQATLDDGCEPVFRVHDSGDLFSVAYIEAWQRVAEALPQVSFWIPTREWARETQLEALQSLAALPNVAVRSSAMAVNQPAPKPEGLGWGSTVHADSASAIEDGAIPCPATRHDGEPTCDGNNSCRACWFADRPVSYMAHGTLKGRAKRDLEESKALPVLQTS